MSDFSATKFILALVFIGMAVTGIMFFAAGLQEGYEVSVLQYTGQLNNSYDKFAEISDNAASIRQRSENVSTDRNWLDVIGGLFFDSYQSIKLTATSLDLFDEMAQSSSQEIGFSVYIKYLRLIVIIIFVVGVLMAILLGRRT